jgi:hypothetical protein
MINDKSKIIGNEKGNETICKQQTNDDDSFIIYHLSFII